MYHISTYDKAGIREKNQISQTDLQNEYKIWIDLEQPTSTELSQIQKIFLIDTNILNQYVTGVKPQIRVLQNYIFTLIISIKFKTLQTLETEAIYMFIGKNWLITIHSSNINLKQITRQIFKNDNKEVIDSSINILYYNIVTKFVDEYEQVLQ